MCPERTLEKTVGVAGFEPATPASRTQCTSSKLLIFLVVTSVSATFCSRSFHPIRCDFVAAFWGRTVPAAALVQRVTQHRRHFSGGKRETSEIGMSRLKLPPFTLTDV